MNTVGKVLTGLGVIAVCGVACVVGIGIGASVVAEEITSYERAKARDSIKEKYGVDLAFLRD